MSDYDVQPRPIPDDEWCHCGASVHRHLHGKFLMRDGTSSDLYVDRRPGDADMLGGLPSE